jgi:hypothetical protein
MKGITTGGSFYAQVGPMVTADVQEKAVVRVTGQGPLTISAIGPSGQSITPYQVEPHTVGSSWDGIVPGDEWGTFWVFPGPGCWDVHAVRGGVVGDIYVEADTPAFTGVAFKIASPRRSIRSGQKITFSIRPDITPGPVEAGLSAHVTVRHAGKVERVLRVKPSGLDVYRLSTRLIVRARTAFTAQATVTFRSTTVTKTVRFTVLPHTGS